MNDPIINQHFVFIDKNNPETFYYGDIIAMKGCSLNGGDPERCYVGEWVGKSVMTWKDHYAEKKAGDTIDGKPVVKAPMKWYDDAWEDYFSIEKDSYDDNMYHECDVAGLSHGDCIQGKVKTDEGTYPDMKRVIVKINHKDADILTLVPFVETDVYGNITDPDWEWLKEEWHFEDDEIGTFVEDTEGQDHVFMFTGMPVTAHRLDLINVDRDKSRERLVKPYRAELAKWFTNIK